MQLPMPDYSVSQPKNKPYPVKLTAFDKRCAISSENIVGATFVNVPLLVFFSDHKFIVKLMTRVNLPPNKNEIC